MAKDRGAFIDNTTITSVKILDSMKMIGEQAFARCTALKKVEISGENVVLHQLCFDGGSALLGLKIDILTTRFGAHMFQACWKMQNKEWFVILGEGAFSSCSRLKKVIIEPGRFYTGEKNGDCE